jgi:glucose-6-phosphate isomerase/transaldolase/glucose-6-phosphate isomerase
VSADNLLERVLAGDTTLWPEGNVASTRLGWLDVHRRLRADATELRKWADGIDARHVVLIGMGGSSLGPEVLRAAVGSDRLVVLDTTDPKTVSRVDLGDSFFVVSSKSGGTLEVMSLLAHCWEQVPDGARYAAITDPGTSLETLARERAFHRVFTNDPNIGGRYSVLSLFGLVPAALLGYDVDKLCGAAADADLGAAAALGVAMGQAARAGQDKVTIVVPEAFAAFGLWVEQLIAESTGKQGTGCVPVPTTDVDREIGTDRFVVPVDLSDPAMLGAEFLKWEVATAIAGHVLGIDPFDEPNVAESKANTAAVLDALPLPVVETATPASMMGWLRDTVRPGDYVCVQAYLPYGQDDALAALRRKVRDGLGGMAVTAGYGPRFLHSTGQLHKGGPNTVVAVQVVPQSPTADVDIPGAPYDFGTLIAAQSIGDLQSLQQHGRRVLRVAADDLAQVS